MKKKEIEKLRAKSIVELEKEAQKAKLHSQFEKAAIVSGNEKNLKKSFFTRKKLSTILTLIKEKQKEN